MVLGLGAGSIISMISDIVGGGDKVSEAEGTSEGASDQRWYQRWYCTVLYSALPPQPPPQGTAGVYVPRYRVVVVSTYSTNVGTSQRWDVLPTLVRCASNELGHQCVGAVAEIRHVWSPEIRQRSNFSLPIDSRSRASVRTLPTLVL